MMLSYRADVCRLQAHRARCERMSQSYVFRQTACCGLSVSHTENKPNPSSTKLKQLKDLRNFARKILVADYMILFHMKLALNRINSELERVLDQ